VYRWDYFVFYSFKIALSIVASIAAALCIQVVVNLRVELQAEAWRLAPDFWRAAVVTTGVVLGLVTAWEVGQAPLNRTRALAATAAYSVIFAVMAVYAPQMRPFITTTALVGAGSVCSRLERWPVKLLFAFAAFGATLYLSHFTIIGFSVGRAAFSSGVYVAVWASTLLIVGRLHHAFGSLFQTAAKV